MLILIPDEYHIGRQSESVVVGAPALALTSARPTMIAKETIRLGVPSPLATMSIESTPVNP